MNSGRAGRNYMLNQNYDEDQNIQGIPRLPQYPIPDRMQMEVASYYPSFPYWREPQEISISHERPSGPPQMYYYSPANTNSYDEYEHYQQECQEEAVLYPFYGPIRKYHGENYIGSGSSLWKTIYNLIAQRDRENSQFYNNNNERTLMASEACNGSFKPLNKVCEDLCKQQKSPSHPVTSSSHELDTFENLKSRLPNQKVIERPFKIIRKRIPKQAPKQKSNRRSRKRKSRLSAPRKQRGANRARTTRKRERTTKDPRPVRKNLNDQELKVKYGNLRRSQRKPKLDKEDGNEETNNAKTA